MSVRMIAGFGLLVAAPVVAQDTPQPAPSPAQAEKRICRREQQTGSIMPGKKTCHTKAEWAALDAANAANAENALSRRSSRGPGAQ